MLTVTIDESLKNISTDITLGCIQAKVNVFDSSKELLKDIKEMCTNLTKNLSIEKISKIREIYDARTFYKTLGKDPNRYRISSEALLRRVLQKKELYIINNIVDINNLVSLKYSYSVGSYDINKIQPPISFTKGKIQQTYKGIGKNIINLENIPVMIDSISSFGSPTSDSERTMITSHTSHIFMCIYSFNSINNIVHALGYAEELLKKHADATEIESIIIN